MTSLVDYSAGHRRLLEAVGQAAGFSDPMAFMLDHWESQFLKAARKGKLVPLEGVLVRDWTRYDRRSNPGVRLGARLYDLHGIRFAAVRFNFDFNAEHAGTFFLAVDRKDYVSLYRSALRLWQEPKSNAMPPILSEEQSQILWKHTIDFLESERLRGIEAYGGRPRRGVLLTGTPGNGKTMALRWLWDECLQRGWDYRIVTPNTYKKARHSCDPENAVQSLFRVERRGIVFFDDMDLALRDRGKAEETEDQAIFLTALDGLHVKEGVVYLFTTNCSLDLIDRAFRRPGRIDVVLHLQKPAALLRRRLIERWHSDILADLDADAVVADTADCSYAEIEELKNLLIMRFLDTSTWDWAWARQQFAINRDELVHQTRSMGFSFARWSNGVADDADE